MHVRRVSVLTDRFPSGEHYPFNLPVLRETASLEFERPVTFFVGENGSGKSTLLKGIAEACGIYIWGGGERARFDESPYEGWLHRYLQVHWGDGRVPGSFFAAESFRSFRQILDVVGKLPRLVSIHAFRATGLVLKELRQRPIAIPVLHWWTGSAAETSQAVELGCYFSIHSAVARQSKFRTSVII